MATNVMIRNSKDLRFDNVSLSGADTAFEIYDSDDIRMNSIQIGSTRTAVAGERVRGLSVNGMTHSQEGWQPTPTRLALIIRSINNGYV